MFKIIVFLSDYKNPFLNLLKKVRQMFAKSSPKKIGDKNDVGRESFPMGW